METRVSIEHVAATGQQTSRDLRGAAPGPVPPGAFPGDRFTVTAGQEKFSPVKYHSFDVGPVTFETTVGPGEDAAAAYARASSVAHAMFEAEFQLKRADYWRRLGQVEPK